MPKTLSGTLGFLIWLGKSCVVMIITTTAIIILDVNSALNGTSTQFKSLSWGMFLEVCLCEVASDISLNSSDKVYTMVPEELLAHLFACLETSGFSKIRFLMKDSWRFARFLCRQFHAAQQAWLECLLWPGIVWSYSDLQSWSEILSSGSSQSKWSYIDNV